MAEKKKNKFDVSSLKLRQDVFLEQMAVVNKYTPLNAANTEVIEFLGVLAKPENALMRRELAQAVWVNDLSEVDIDNEIPLSKLSEAVNAFLFKYVAPFIMSPGSANSSK